MKLFSPKSTPPPDAPSLSLPALSLMNLEPDDSPLPPVAAWENDLGISEVVAALTLSRRHRQYIRGVLARLTTDERVIARRQAVLADFIANPALADGIEALLPQLASLDQDSNLLGKRRRSLIMETTDRISELEVFINLLADLYAVLAAADLSSDGLVSLRGALATVLETPTYADLKRKLPALREPLQNIGSINIGINLDYELRPTSAVLLSINHRDEGGPRSLLGRLFGDEEDDFNELGGMRPPHRFPRDKKLRRFHELFQDVNDLMEQTARPVADALRRYVRTSSQTLLALEPELAFFVGAARMIERLQAQGIDFCQPEPLPMSQRTAHIQGLVNLQLALAGAQVVPSEVRFDDEGRIGVLTGPNSGGKTTYLRSVGLAQVVFQAGLFVPAAAARISPVASILTHFPRLETRQQGRLAEEAERLRDIFAQMDDTSLVLLNETFSSTAFGEALYLAHDMLSGLSALGVRAIFATHLVEVVDNFEEIEAAVDAHSRLYSLVAGIETNADGQPRPTYRITRRGPLGRSYAQEIARRYGISLQQILANNQSD